MINSDSTNKNAIPQRWIQPIRINYTNKKRNENILLIWTKQQIPLEILNSTEI